MSGTGSGRAPRTPPEWAGDVEKRLRALEQATTTRVGRWVISERDGELVATTIGRTVNLTAAAVPAATQQGTALHATRTVTIEGSPTGGTWTLTFSGATTTDLAYNITAANLLAALIALDASYSSLDFAVTGSAGGPYTVITPVGSLSGEGSNLTGGTDMGVTVA